MKKNLQTLIRKQIKRTILLALTISLIFSAAAFAQEILPVPANVSAVAGPLMSVKITFTDNSDLETYYEIHHTDVSDNYYAREKTVGAMLGSEISYYISDGPYPPVSDEVFYMPNTLVYIKIRAVIDDNGSLTYGDFSPVVTVLTNPVPATPTNFHVTAEGHNVHLTWTDNSISEAAYYLARFEGNFYDWPVLIQVPANATEYDDLNVPENHEYQYWLIAIDDYEYRTRNPEDPESWMGLFTIDDSRVAKAEIAIVDLPSPPYVTAGAISPTSIYLAFSDPNCLECWYQLQVSTSEDTSAVCRTLPVYSLSGTWLEGLEPNTTYYFRLRGVMHVYAHDYYGPYSNTASATTLPPPDAPLAKPATSITNKSFRANWSAVATAQWYQLDVFDNKDGSYVAGYEAKDVLDTFAVVTTKKPVFKYSYRVRAVEDYALSGNSNVIAVTKTKKAAVTLIETDEKMSSPYLSVHCFPNPVVDKFKIIISSPDRSIAELQILNYCGTQIDRQTLTTNEVIDLDATAYPPGLYIMKARVGNWLGIAKIIKTH